MKMVIILLKLLRVIMSVLFFSQQSPAILMGEKNIMMKVAIGIIVIGVSQNDFNSQALPTILSFFTGAEEIPPLGFPHEPNYAMPNHSEFGLS